jgi:hypothetical protein
MFTGDVINVSGASDFDKEVKDIWEYLFTHNCDRGNKYKSYFSSASSYAVSNYASDRRRGHAEKSDGSLDIDLTDPLPASFQRKFDVVFNHTVLEHVFDVFTAFKNLCLLSRDIVILVVPAVQPVHDYTGDYRDYWRFTPFAVDELFKRNDFTVLYRNATTEFGSAIYYFYIASRIPEKWTGCAAFKKGKDTTQINLGHSVFLSALFHYRIEKALRMLGSLPVFRRRAD